MSGKSKKFLITQLKRRDKWHDKASVNNANDLAEKTIDKLNRIKYVEEVIEEQKQISQWGRAMNRSMVKLLEAKSDLREMK